MNIYWARTDLWWAVLCFSGLVFVMLLYHRSKLYKALRSLSGHAPFAHTFEGYSWMRMLARVSLYTLGTFFLTVALLRPEWGEVEQRAEQMGRDVLIALDVSRSMLANDMKPDRLTFSKQSIKRLLPKLKTERVGLMVFSGSAFVQCPLTDDMAAFNLFLDAIDVETISSGTTAIDQALTEAIRMFQKTPERKNKLLLLFTDGEDFSSNLAKIKREAASIGLHIVTIGVGTPEGAPVPLYDIRMRQIGHQLDARGNVVISRINEGILQRLAQDTGGTFVVASKDPTLQSVVDFVRSFEQEKLEDRNIKQFEQQYHYPLLLSFICFSLEWLL